MICNEKVRTPHKVVGSEKLLLPEFSCRHHLTSNNDHDSNIFQEREIPFCPEKWFATSGNQMRSSSKAAPTSHGSEHRPVMTSWARGSPPPHLLCSSTPSAPPRCLFRSQSAGLTWSFARKALRKLNLASPSPFSRTTRLRTLGLVGGATNVARSYVFLLQHGLCGCCGDGKRGRFRSRRL